MGATQIRRIVTALLLAGTLPAIGRAQTPAVDTDFARGDFRALGWQAKGDWDITRYPKDLANSPGRRRPVRRQQARRDVDQVISRGAACPAR